MTELYAIFFGIPSFIILAILLFIGIFGTIKDVYTAIKTNDYNYLFLFLTLTISSAMIGWYIGSKIEIIR